MKRYFLRLPFALSFALALSFPLFLGGCGPDQGGGFHKGGKDGGGGDDSGVIVCTNPPKDSDGDGISDHDEGAEESPPRDTDGDGMPDYLDPDSDNDGIPDAIEGRNANPCTPPVDSDGDGKPDFRDLDSDSPTDSTIPDHEEAGVDPTHPIDSNADGRPDYMDPDDDGDGIPDQFELTPQGQAVAATTRANAPDTDSDGTPDYLDTDSDNDTISDKQEGAVDTDGDLIPNYRDLDSDGDCISDALEAGDTNPNTPAVDTDGDGAPDFEDVDSDNDGLVDAKEDLNCNGVLDPCATPCTGACETDRLKADTDGDGVSDLVESLDCSVKTPAEQAQLKCQCDGAVATSSPLTHGDFVFVSDYMKAPTPTVETLNMSTDVSQADVIFALDSTGSMGNCLANLASGLSGIVPQVTAKVKSVSFGVLDFKDYGDVYVDRYDQRNTTVTGAGLTAVQNALSALTASGGGDGPEAGWEALYAIAGGMPSFNNNGYNSVLPLGAIPAGESGGTIPGAGFRAGSVPIVVTVSDAVWHDNTDYGFAAPSRANTITALTNLSAHVIGLGALGTQQTGDPKGAAIATAQATGAIVQPADFGPVGTRPGNCAITQCCTGQSGAGENPIGGVCPLGYTVNDNDGSGVSGAVTSGIVALANGLKFDIHVQAGDVDPNTVDDFIAKLVPNLSGAGPASVCITMPAGALQDNFTGPKATPGADTVLDTFPGVSHGQQVCFDVVPKMNTTVMNTNMPQLFRARLQVKGVAGANTVNLGTPRDVFFLVPPVIKNGPIG